MTLKSKAESAKKARRRVQRTVSTLKRRFGRFGKSNEPSYRYCADFSAKPAFLAI